MVPYADAGPLYGIVWPILISVSVAPGSYFFCAKTDVAETASASSRSCQGRLDIFPPPGLANDAGYTARHQVHERDENNAIDRPRRRLRDLVGDVRDELDEDRAKEGALDG